MKKKKAYVCFVLFIVISGALFANQTVEELKKKLEEVSGKERVNVLNRLSYAHYGLSVKKVLEYGKQALILSRTLKDLKGEANALKNTGFGYMQSENFERSLKYAEKSLEIFERLGNKSDIASSLHLIGHIYYHFDHCGKSLEYYQKALKLREELGSKREIASILGNIAIVYKTLGECEKDLEYQLKALEIREEIGDERGIAISISSIAHTYKVLQNFEKALEYFHKSLETFKRLGNKLEMGITLESIGSIYGAVYREFEKALEYSQKSLKIKEKIGTKQGIYVSLNNIGEWYSGLKNDDKALEYFLKALRLGEEIGDKRYISNLLRRIGVIYIRLHDYDKALKYLKKSLKRSQDNGKEMHSGYFLAMCELNAAKGDYKTALEYHRLYSAKRDEEFSFINRKQVAEIQTKYETLKKEKEIESLKNDKQIQQLLLNRQKMIRNVSIVVALLLLIIAAQFFRRYHYLFSFWKKKNYIAHYKLVDKIGTGGMGDIYKARDLQNKSRVSICAVKVLKEEYNKDDRYKKRFKNEAAMIDQLQHPNIVRIMERGEYEGTLYIAMELLEGDSLADLMEKEGQIDIKTALAMMIQMASAIAEIHKREIIHRDLKPENIMVIRTAENSVLIKVLDFGLARAQNLTRLTRTGMIMGTIFYIAPEQLSRSQVLPAGDIYSLGVIYYQILTGEKPFCGDTAFDIARQIIKKEPVHIETLHPGIPADLGSLVKKMMAKDPRKRPLANEVLKQLKRIEISHEVIKIEFNNTMNQDR